MAQTVLYYWLPWQFHGNVLVTELNGVSQSALPRINTPGVCKPANFLAQATNAFRPHPWACICPWRHWASKPMPNQNKLMHAAKPPPHAWPCAPICAQWHANPMATRGSGSQFVFYKFFSIGKNSFMVAWAMWRNFEFQIRMQAIKHCIANNTNAAHAKGVGSGLPCESKGPAQPLTHL